MKKMFLSILFTISVGSVVAVDDYDRMVDNLIFHLKLSRTPESRICMERAYPVDKTKKMIDLMRASDFCINRRRHGKFPQECFEILEKIDAFQESIISRYEACMKQRK